MYVCMCDSAGWRRNKTGLPHFQAILHYAPTAHEIVYLDPAYAEKQQTLTL